jgi:hypothetical protein
MKKTPEKSLPRLMDLFRIRYNALREPLKTAGGREIALDYQGQSSCQRAK